MPEKLINYFEKQQELFTEYYNESCKYYTVNSVHEMRLCMKRLRALFLFLEALEPDTISTRSLLSSFRKLFKRAGHIRDIQIQKKTGLNLEEELNASFSEYIHFLSKLEKKAINTFEKKMHGYKPEKDFTLLRNIISDTLSTYPTDDITIRGKEIIHSKFTQIHTMAQKRLTTTQLHAIRTKLKQIAYLLKIWKGHDSVTQVIPVDRSFLQEVEIKLGLWHDYVVAEAYVKKFIETHNDGESLPPQYQLLLATVKRYRKTLAIQIKPQLHALFESFEPIH